MAAIHKRTIFFEVDKNGNHLPCDFARVTTNIGTMLEPRTELFSRHTVGQQFDDADMSDEMTMVTGIEGISLDREKYLLGEAIHGGYAMPRTGR